MEMNVESQISTHFESTLTVVVGELGGLVGKSACFQSQERGLGDQDVK